MAVQYVLYTVYWYNSLICVYSDLVKCICLSLSQRMAKKVANGQLEEEDLLVSDLKALLTCTAPV